MIFAEAVERLIDWLIPWGRRMRRQCDAEHD
jgi:hypothetical protein